MSDVTLLGLGPVGLATAWELLSRGYSVNAYDSDLALTEKLQRGDFFRVQEISEDLQAMQQGRLSIHSRMKDLSLSDTIILCVSTPAGSAGFDLSGLIVALKSVRAEKGSGIRRHFIVRSTLTPGTVERELLPLLSMGEEYDFSYYPEFLREKNIRSDIENPPLSIASHSSPVAKRRFLKIFPRVVNEASGFSAVEILKISCNAFHALKVVFANEVADLCEEYGAIGDEVMTLFREDTKLNISGLYLKPGAPFSGPCLDKDLRALEWSLDAAGQASPLLRAVRKSNDERINRSRAGESR